jgi:hypothetical protein
MRSQKVAGVIFSSHPRRRGSSYFYGVIDSRLRGSDGFKAISIPSFLFTSKNRAENQTATGWEPMVVHL